MAHKRSLHEFLDDLSADPALLAKYNSNPKQTMQSEGLSQADQKLLATGTNEQIRDKLKKEMHDVNAYVIRMSPQP